MIQLKVVFSEVYEVMKELVFGTKHVFSQEVIDSQCAKAVGSGSLAVLGTPVMIALMEKATCECIASFLDDNETTVGTKIDVSHNAPTVVGREVTVSAELVEADRRKLVFKVEAGDEAGVIGNGRIERFVVDAKTFMEKAEKR